MVLFCFQIFQDNVTRNQVEINKICSEKLKVAVNIFAIAINEKKMIQEYDGNE